MKTAKNYIEHNKVRLQGYSVITINEAIHAVEKLASRIENRVLKQVCEDCIDYCHYCEHPGDCPRLLNYKRAIDK